MERVRKLHQHRLTGGTTGTPIPCSSEPQIDGQKFGYTPQTMRGCGGHLGRQAAVCSAPLGLANATKFNNCVKC